MKYFGVLLLSTMLLASVTAAPDKKTHTGSTATTDPKKANDSTRQSRCYSNQFECSNGQCISKNLICNDRNDCRDGSDESSSICFSHAAKTTTTTTTTPSYIDINIDSRAEFSCANGEFLCTSGECILQSRICDGRHDCRDGSDEEGTICRVGGGNNRECLATEFRCNSGECILAGLRCDGSNDCFDSSDEDWTLCQRASEQRPVPTSRPLHGGIALESSTSNTWGQRLTPCTIPPQPANGHWKLHRSLCDSNTECNAPLNVRSMDPGSYLVYSCDQGFVLNGSRDVLCGPGGKWVHEPRCDEIRCHDLSSSATEALCTWNNVAVSCEIPAPIGTTASLKCRQGFVQEVMYEQGSTNVKCQADGHWNPKPIQCVKKPKKVKLVLEGQMVIEE